MIVYRNPERDTCSRCDSLGGKFKSVRNLGKLRVTFSVILKMACKKFQTAAIFKNHSEFCYFLNKNLLKKIILNSFFFPSNSFSGKYLVKQNVIQLRKKNNFCFLCVLYLGIHIHIISEKVTLHFTLIFYYYYSDLS